LRSQGYIISCIVTGHKSLAAPETPVGIGVEKMREKLALIFAISIMPFFVVTAQDAAEPIVTTVTDPEHGTYLADGAGRTLYLFTQDPSGESTCVDECALNWPPLVAEGELSAGAGVAQTLLGTVTRPDGVEQVTYSG